MQNFIKGTLLATLLMAAGARAAVVITIQQSGANLVVSSTGTLSTSVCTSTVGGATSTGNDLISGAGSELAFGPVGSSQVACNGATITPNSDFGSGATLNGPTNTGVSYYFAPRSGFWGPAGWTSATNLTATMTFAGASLASAGLTAGNYVYTLNNGGSSDTITLRVIAAPAPAPALADWAKLVMAALLLGIGSIAVARHRQ